MKRIAIREPQMLRSARHLELLSALLSRKYSSNLFGGFQALRTATTNLETSAMLEDIVGSRYQIVLFNILDSLCQNLERSATRTGLQNFKEQCRRHKLQTTKASIGAEDEMDLSLVYLDGEATDGHAFSSQGSILSSSSQFGIPWGQRGGLLSPIAAAAEEVDIVRLTEATNSMIIDRFLRDDAIPTRQRSARLSAHLTPTALSPLDTGTSSTAQQETDQQLLSSPSKGPRQEQRTIPDSAIDSPVSLQFSPDSRAESDSVLPSSISPLFRPSRSILNRLPESTASPTAGDIIHTFLHLHSPESTTDSTNIDSNLELPRLNNDELDVDSSHGESMQRLISEAVRNSVQPPEHKPMDLSSSENRIAHETARPDSGLEAVDRYPLAYESTEDAEAMLIRFMDELPSRIEDLNCTRGSRESDVPSPSTAFPRRSAGQHRDTPTPDGLYPRDPDNSEMLFSPLAYLQDNLVTVSKPFNYSDINCQIVRRFFSIMSRWATGSAWNRFRNRFMSQKKVCSLWSRVDSLVVHKTFVSLASAYTSLAKGSRVGRISSEPISQSRRGAESNRLSITACLLLNRNLRCSLLAVFDRWKSFVTYLSAVNQTQRLLAHVKFAIFGNAIRMVVRKNKSLILSSFSSWHVSVSRNVRGQLGECVNLCQLEKEQVATDLSLSEERLRASYRLLANIRAKQLSRAIQKVRRLIRKRFKKRRDANFRTWRQMADSYRWDLSKRFVQRLRADFSSMESRFKAELEKKVVENNELSTECCELQIQTNTLKSEMEQVLRRLAEAEFQSATSQTVTLNHAREMSEMQELLTTCQTLLASEQHYAARRDGLVKASLWLASVVHVRIRSGLQSWKIQNQIYKSANVDIGSILTERRRHLRCFTRILFRSLITVFRRFYFQFSNNGFTFRDRSKTIHRLAVLFTHKLHKTLQKRLLRWKNLRLRRETSSFLLAVTVLQLVIKSKQHESLANRFTLLKTRMFSHRIRLRKVQRLLQRHFVIRWMRTRLTRWRSKVMQQLYEKAYRHRLAEEIGKRAESTSSYSTKRKFFHGWSFMVRSQQRDSHMVTPSDSVLIVTKVKAVLRLQSALSSLLKRCFKHFDILRIASQVKFAGSQIRSSPAGQAAFETVSPMESFSLTSVTSSEFFETAPQIQSAPLTEYLLNRVRSESTSVAGGPYVPPTVARLFEQQMSLSQSQQFLLASSNAKLLRANSAPKDIPMQGPDTKSSSAPVRIAHGIREIMEQRTRDVRSLGLTVPDENTALHVSPSPSPLAATPRAPKTTVNSNNHSHTNSSNSSGRLRASSSSPVARGRKMASAPIQVLRGRPLNHQNVR